jgi:hypothetical protein
MGSDYVALDPVYQRRLQYVRGMLVEYLDEKVHFRKRKADDAPWSAGKNSSYAGSIERIIEFVCNLPLNDPTLVALEKVCLNPYIDAYQIPKCVRESADWETIHFGPRGKEIDEDAVEDEFRSWVQGIIDGVETLGRCSSRCAFLQLDSTVSIACAWTKSIRSKSPCSESANAFTSGWSWLTVNSPCHVQPMML